MRFVLVDRAEVQSVLHRVLTLLSMPGGDVGMYCGFDTIEELRDHVAELLNQVDSAREDQETLRDLWLLFAPTGTLGETSFRNGWETDYLSLAEKFDGALHHE